MNLEIAETTRLSALSTVDAAVAAAPESEPLVTAAMEEAETAFKRVDDSYLPLDKRRQENLEAARNRGHWKPGENDYERNTLCQQCEDARAKMV